MDTPLRASWLTRLLEAVVLPPVCCLCGLRALGYGLDLCAICRGSLPLAAAPAGLSQRFDRVLIPYIYAYPIDHFVRALKFRGERSYARVLGTLLAQAQLQSAVASGEAAPHGLVPLPLHGARLRQRGFNQAHELARYAGAQLNVPVVSGLLIRIRATSEQSRLDTRQRHLNVLGAFALARPICPGARLALVDDVVTTGSTAGEAAFALRAAGASRVELWAAARALTRRDVQRTRSAVAADSS